MDGCGSGPRFSVRAEKRTMRETGPRAILPAPRFHGEWVVGRPVRGQHAPWRRTKGARVADQGSRCVWLCDSPPPLERRNERFRVRSGKRKSNDSRKPGIINCFHHVVHTVSRSGPPQSLLHETVRPSAMVVATYAFAVLPAVAAKTSQRPRVTRVDASGVPHGKDGRVFSGRASCSSAPKAVTARGSGFARTFSATHRRNVRRFADNEKNRNNTDEEGTGKVRLDGKDDASNDESQKNFFQSYASKTKTAMEQIQSLGMAGVTCYGILNTVYYTLAFSAAWTFRSVPADLSTAEAFKLAGTTMALVWTGSQVRVEFPKSRHLRLPPRS